MRRAPAAAAAAALALTWLAVASPAAATDPDDVAAPEAATVQARAAFARAMGVPLKAVWRVDEVPLPASSAQAVALVGRFVRGEQTLGGLVLLQRCPAGRCPGPQVQLGRAGDARVLAVVDLLGAPTPLAIADAAWPLARVPQPAGPARWPALAIQTREQRRGGESIETVRLVDLKEPDATTLVQVQTQQWRRGGYRTRTAELVASPGGGPLDLVLTQLVQGGMCGAPECVPPPATEQMVRYRLERGARSYRPSGAAEGGAAGSKEGGP